MLTIKTVPDGTSCVWTLQAVEFLLKAYEVVQERYPEKGAADKALIAVRLTFKEAKVPEGWIPEFYQCPLRCLRRLGQLRAHLEKVQNGK